MRVYSREFRLDVTRRIRDGEKVPVLSQELGIHRKVLYEWARKVNEGGEANLRDRGRPLKTAAPASNGPRRIAELEHMIAQQQLIIEFFRYALQRFKRERR